MLQLVNVGHKSLADYATIATRGLMDEILRLAEPLAGKRVLELSATAFGGGVAEIQYTLVPLMRDAGLEVEWRILRGAEDFFEVTKTIHNALQGNPQGLSEEQAATFRRYQELNAREIDVEAYDFVFVHDPQPLGLIDHLGGGHSKWIWRGHIDFSAPNPEVLEFLLPSLRRYDAAIFHLAAYVPQTTGLPSLKLRQNIEWVERETIRRALDSAAGVKKDAAELMGISQRALSYYLAKYRLD